MSHEPTVVLVHGAFLESASWNAVIEHLRAEDVPAIAVANPLRALASDAQHLRDVIGSLTGPIVLVGHTYGGMVITEASADDDAVAALVYVSAFAPDTGESAFGLSAGASGSRIGDAHRVRMPATGAEAFIRRERFREHLAADLSADTADLLWATQRPATDAALNGRLRTSRPGWRQHPSWHVFGTEDRIIPPAVLGAGAARAASRMTTAVAGASHLALISHPRAVADSVLDAVRAVQSARVRLAEPAWATA